MIDCVVSILRLGSPTEIIKLVILFVAVQVTALHPLRAWPHKRFKYQSMNAPIIFFLVSIKFNSQISIWRTAWGHPMASSMKIVIRRYAGTTPYSTISCYLVVGEIWNFLLLDFHITFRFIRGLWETWQLLRTSDAVTQTPGSASGTGP